MKIEVGGWNAQPLSSFVVQTCQKHDCLPRREYRAPRTCSLSITCGRITLLPFIGTVMIGGRLAPSRIRS